MDKYIKLIILIIKSKNYIYSYEYIGNNIDSMFPYISKN